MNCARTLLVPGTRPILPILCWLVLPLGPLPAETAGELDEALLNRCLATLRADPLFDSPFHRLMDHYRRAGRLEDLEGDLRGRIQGPEWRESGPALLARVLLHQGKAEAARQALADALKSSPQSADLLELQSLVEEQLDDLPGALRAAEEAAKLLPDTERRLRLRERQAQLLFKSDDREKACALLAAELVHIPLNTFPPHRRLMRLLRQFRCWDAALGVVETHLRSLPEGSREVLEGRSLRAELLMESGQVEQALNAFKNLLAEVPLDGPEWRTITAQLLRLAAQPESSSAALRFLEDQTRGNPGSAWTLILANAYFVIGRMEQGDQVLVSLREPGAEMSRWVTDGGSERARADRAAEMARLFSSRHQLGPAVAWFEQAVALSPKQTDLLWQLGDLLGRSGQVQRQREIHEKILEVAPDSHHARQARHWLHRSFLSEGIEHFIRGGQEEAGAQFRKAEQHGSDPFEKYRAALWMALALRRPIKGSDNSPEPNWPPSEEIPDTLMLSPIPGLEVAARSARWLSDHLPATTGAGPGTPPGLARPLSFKPAWSFEPPNPENPIRCMTAGEDALVCQLESGALLCLEIRTGLPRWLSPSSRSTSLRGQLGYSGNLVFESDGELLRARKMTDGTKAWEKGLGARVLAITAGNGVAAGLTAADEIHVFALADGRPIWKQVLERVEAGDAAAAIFPRIHLIEGQILAVHIGFIAFERGEGRLLWKFLPQKSWAWKDQLKGYRWGGGGLILERNSGEKIWLPSGNPIGVKVFQPSADPAFVSSVEPSPEPLVKGPQDRLLLTGGWAAEIDERGGVQGFCMEESRP